MHVAAQKPQAGYKNWSLGIVLQGVGKQNARLTQDIVQPLSENYGNFPAIIDGQSWSRCNTPEQNQHAKYPRYHQYLGRQQLHHVRLLA